MESYEIKSAYFENLKGLKNCTFEFSKYLTAVMGVNGSGKTTVIHALACAYQPTDDGQGENHRFSDFFIPNTDALWNGSKFSIINEKTDGKKKIIQPSRKYEKAYDRWNPRYADRPKRNIYYIGIDTCLPEIEKKTSQTRRIIYSSNTKEDKISKKINREAAFILNKSYETLMDNVYDKKHFWGVKLQSGLKYSSLSMGTGEQRTIKILNTVLHAEPYSLILIDEIDLLLHVCSLKRLIQRLNDIAQDRHLQIIFTTHSLEMIRLTQYVTIQYIDTVIQPDGMEQTVVYSKISSDLVFNLTGSNEHLITIYVEDEFAKAIVKKVLRMLNMSIKADVLIYGAVENAFTLAAAKILAAEDITNTLIVLDGDKYRTCDEKKDQIKKKLSGTEISIEEKWHQAMSLIEQFNLDEGLSPEQFLHDILVENGDATNELVIAASEIRAVHDSHEWLHLIREKLNDTEENVVRDIIDITSKSDKWSKYIHPIMSWLAQRENV